MNHRTRLSTGVKGLDEILHGGFIPHNAYLVRGGPGCGKTTLGLHFLSAGVASGETTLFITLGETEEQIRTNAANIQMNLGGIHFLDLSPTSSFFSEIQTYDIFSPADVEREPVTRSIMDEIERIKPSRVFIDAITQFRFLSSDAFQFRKQILSFLRYLLERQITTLFTYETSETLPDDDVQFISDGVIKLSSSDTGRHVSVSKFRGSGYHTGTHAMRLTSAGMEIFPRLLPGDYRRDFEMATISSGIPELDELLHGGLERGTVTITSGPTGVGKTTIGIQFMKEAAGRGERSVIYTFEEDTPTLLQRCESINCPARSMVERGTLSVVQIEPLRYTADEFALLVRKEVEEKNARIIMIDSIAGYRLSVRGDDLVAHLHALCKYMKNMGVTVLLVNELETISGDFRATEIGISYLADNILFMRYMERYEKDRLEISKIIGVLKKRLSDFEKTPREIRITRYGIKVGHPMDGIKNVLGQRPEMVQTPKGDL